VVTGITIPHENQDALFSSMQRAVTTFSSKKQRITQSLGQGLPNHWVNVTGYLNFKILMGDGYGHSKDLAKWVPTSWVAG
jgi:hypothetical protein